MLPLFLVSSLSLLVSCADVAPHSLTSDLDKFDLLQGPELTANFKVEMEAIRALLAKDLDAIGMTDIEKFVKEVRGDENNEDPQLTRVQNALEIYANTLLLHDEVLPAISRLVTSGNEYSLTLLSQAIKSIPECRDFWLTRHFINDHGKATVLQVSKLLSLDSRFNKIRPWIRLVFIFLEKLPFVDAVAVDLVLVSKIDGKPQGKPRPSSAYKIQRGVDNEKLLTGLMKLQYLASLMHPNVKQLSKQDSHLHLISRLSGIRGIFDALIQGLTNCMTAYLCAAMNLKYTRIVTSLWQNLAFTINGNPLVIEKPQPLEWLTVKAICSGRQEVAQLYPGFQGQLEKLCGITAAREELLKADETPKQGKQQPSRSRPKGKARKEEKKNAQRNAENSSHNSSKAIAQVLKPEVDDSDLEDEVDKLAEGMSSLSFVDKAESWTHTKAWLTAAVVHVAEYCRLKVLYPHFFPTGNVPAKFNWNNLVTQQSSDEIKFCVKVVNKRNAIVKTDEIFKFLPDLDTTYAFLPKDLKADKKAVDFVLTFAPGQRLNEAPKAESTLMKETSARSQLIILGLHRACNRIRDAVVEVSEIFNLCQGIRTLRNKVAHPHEFSPSQIELLKKELKDWI